MVYYVKIHMYEYLYNKLAWSNFDIKILENNNRGKDQI